MSRTSSGISTSGSIETSWPISSIGKIGVRSSGPAGCMVAGLSGGLGSPGRSGSRLTQWVGIASSGSVYLTVASLMSGSLFGSRRAPGVAHLAAVDPDDGGDAVAVDRDVGRLAAESGLAQRVGLATQPERRRRCE